MVTTVKMLNLFFVQYASDDQIIPAWVMLTIHTHTSICKLLSKTLHLQIFTK